MPRSIRSIVVGGAAPFTYEVGKADGRGSTIKKIEKVGGGYRVHPKSGAPFTFPERSVKKVDY